jgi:nitroreductase
MQFAASVEELAKKRISARDYEPRKLEDPLRQKIMDILSSRQDSIFDSSIRLELVSPGSGRKQRLGTYGFISGARDFIVAVVKKEQGKQALIDVGFVLEKIILYCTGIDLGTCWLGGTFTRSGFAAAAGQRPDEAIPAVTPVGHISDKKSMKSSLMRTITGSKNRKPWEEIFFEKSFGKPLDKSEIGSYARALEVLRLAPSASNKQPWRIIRENKDKYNFFLKNSLMHIRTPDYLNLQYIDMGIALSHFELACREQGLSGKWVDDASKTQDSGLDHIITWKAGDRDQSPGALYSEKAKISHDCA